MNNPLERALKRFEKSKKYKSKNLDYDIEYLSILRRRGDFLSFPHTDDLIKIADAEIADMDREQETIKFLKGCLEWKIWGFKSDYVKKCLGIDEVQND